MGKKKIAVGLFGVTALVGGTLSGLAAAAPATSSGPSVKAVAELLVPARGTLATGLTGPGGIIEVDVSVGGGQVGVGVSASAGNEASASEANFPKAKKGDVLRVEMASDRPTGSTQNPLRWVGASVTDLRTHESVGVEEQVLRDLPKLQTHTKTQESSTTELTYLGGKRSLDGRTLLANLADTRYATPGSSPWDYYLSSIVPLAGPALKLENITHKAGVRRSFRSIDPKRGDKLDVTLMSQPRSAVTTLVILDLRNGKSMAFVVP